MPEKSDAVGAVNVTVSDEVAPLVGAVDIEDGHTRAGGALSATTTGNVQDDLSPALSKAVQVTLVDVRTVNRVVPESGQEMFRMPELSVAETLPMKDTCGSGRLSADVVVYVMLTGQLIAGGVMSTMVTEKEHELDTVWNESGDRERDPNKHSRADDC